MKSIAHFFKSTWNFFFSKKETQLGCDGLPIKNDYKIVTVDINKTCLYCLGETRMEFNGKMVKCPNCEGTGKYTHWAKVIAESKTIEQKVEKSQPHTQLFRKQQLTGKICRIGKSRFRIKKKIGLTGSEKLRYEITQL